MNGYNLSRSWFDWAFENPDINTPAHTALFMWVIEKWNRLGQKEKFGLSTSEAMEVLGIRSVNTYKKVFDNLVEWGFIEVIQQSKNQHTATIVALSKFDKATGNALDKALIKHVTKQSESTRQSTVSIDKPENQETKKPTNQETSQDVETEVPTIDTVTEFDETAEEKPENTSPQLAPGPPPSTEVMGESVSFQQIWDTYDKKIGDRQRCEKKWYALSDKEKWLAWQHIPAYVRSTPEKKYRANLETYLNQKRWNNEIIHSHAKPGNKAAGASAASAKPFLEKPRATSGNPVRKNIFGKEEKTG
ncbi:hypothetical protein [Emticicia sp. C21]|uniref:hypothetical protein n=1 Tax=Emticicia sp. C21 TaxID=2302915 RepID=UPI000E34B5CC|nr:hypothetical protein [Emticicia sp. C21]RFS16987.1 hypothetical protein D0T08_09935 [Emticicia sp. C21]